MSRAKPIDYSDVLRDGLSSAKSYAVLKCKSRQPVYLCLKPFVYRLSPQVIYVGGKLSAFCDASSHKLDGLSDTDRRSLVASAFKTLNPNRVNETRAGSYAGIQYLAGYVNGAKFISKFAKTGVETLLAEIEAKFKIEIENRDKVKAFLNDRYSLYLPSLFPDNYNVGTTLSDRLVGKGSDVIFGKCANPSNLLKKYNLIGATEDAEEDQDE